MADTTELAERALTIADEVDRPPSLEKVTGLLNAVGITRARNMLREAPDVVAAARLDLREAQNVQQQAKEAYDTAVVEAEWALGGCFEARSNKQWLIRDAAGVPVAEDDQKSYTADERKAWLSHHAALQPDVRAAIVRLSTSDREVARARDDLAVAEMRLTVAKHDVDAAAAELRFLALTINQ